MSIKDFKLISAAIGATAVVAMGALPVVFSTVSAAAAGDVPSGTVPTSHATIGQTVTPSTPPPAPLVSQAKPTLTGPAPLPLEEQGLPG